MKVSIKHDLRLDKTVSLSCYHTSSFVKEKEMIIKLPRIYIGTIFLNMIGIQIGILLTH